MLKKIRGLFLGLVVLAGSACVTPTHASSAPNIIITNVQAAGVSGAKEELVTIYNNTLVEMDITGWCLKNKAAISFVCFQPEYSTVTPPQSAQEIPPKILQPRYILQGYSTATIASEEYVMQSQRQASYFSFVYKVTNSSSGSIVSSADTITLVDEKGAVVDSTSWSTTLTTGKVWARTQILSMPDIYATSNNATDWSVKSKSDPPKSTLVIEYVVVEETPDGEDEGEVLPGNNTIGLSPVITELLPNPVGADAGKEFIELYNPNNQDSIYLANYKLRIGVDTFKWYAFPGGAYIGPHQYLAFFNDVINFSLPNTKGSVQLFKDGVAVGNVITYESPKDDYAWALIDSQWEYTSIPTPGMANQSSGKDDDIGANAVAAKPCAVNQFRNPETGRCKLIAVAAAPTPCKEGQERNPETNRCRAIATATGPAPCKEGQERNPETNRCRNITKMSNANYGVKGVDTKADAQISWYYWVGIGGVVLLVAGYAVWEWRQEIHALWQRVYRHFARQ